MEAVGRRVWLPGRNRALGLWADGEARSLRTLGPGSLLRAAESRDRDQGAPAESPATRGAGRPAAGLSLWFRITSSLFSKRSWKTWFYVMSYFRCWIKKKKKLKKKNSPVIQTKYVCRPHTPTGHPEASSVCSDHSVSCTSF